MDELYHGQPFGRLENNHVIIDYLTEAGPRIVRFVPKALGENLLAETPDYELPSPYGPFHLRGGHRLWHAPESSARTYVPDDSGVVVDVVEGGVRLTYDEPHTGIRKELHLTLQPDAPVAHLVHRFTNTNLWSVELAPWAITQMRMGGTAVFPQNTEAIDPEGLQANRHLVLWQYSRWDDPRLVLGEEAIEIVTQPIAAPFKMGYFNRVGWVEYRYKDVVFRKEFTPQPDRPHVDMNCNTETYTNDRHIELETLGPLVTLAPGETVEHVERWTLSN
ncbi:MAG: hypothetical protein R3C44_22720 [Chloroflexota bacterium]